MKKIILFFLSLYCILSPFYLIKSGYPQIADIFLVLSFILFLFNFRIKKDRILVVILIILFFIITINLVWSLIDSDLSYNLYSLYYIYNFIPVIIVFNLYNYYGKNILNPIYKAMFASLLIQVIISPFLINTSLSRQDLLFNNPNQLGYYSLLTLSILTLLFYLLKFSLLQYFIIAVATVYLALLSNSSSTILSITIVLLVQLYLMLRYIFNNKHRLYFFLAVLIILLFGVMLKDSIVDMKLIDNALSRIENKETTSSNILEERHYDILFRNPELVFTGAGEGNYERFGSSTEIHSTLISFLFNYGIVTMIFLIVLFLLLIKKPTFVPIMILLSIHLYGLTHNGIRQPYFWLMHTIIFIGNSEGVYSIEFIKNYLKQSKT